MSFYEGLRFIPALTDFTPRAFDEGLAASGRGNAQRLLPRLSS